MSLFEVGMLVCFGVSWPFALYKTWKTKRTEGKSRVFLWFVFIGYLSGTAHKAIYSQDPVIILYVLNGAMVLADIILVYRYRKPEADSRTVEPPSIPME